MKKNTTPLKKRSSLPATQQTKTLPLIIDHDNGVDDIIATILQLLYNPERIKTLTIVPADCYALPAVWVNKQLKNLFLPASINIPIGIGKDEGINKFPKIWRDDSWALARLPILGKENESNLQKFSIKNIPSALSVLTQALQESPTHVDILATGPCTNIAKILNMRPELKNKIHRIYMMGGALYVKGNVIEPGRNGSAEWNIYNNPQAFQDILKTKIPLTLIALDATQYTPIRNEFITQLKNNFTINACRFAYEGLQIIKPLIDCGQYFFWDVLTSAAIIKPEIIKTKPVKINVITNGPSEGKIVEDNNGFNVDLAVWADQELFEKTVLDILLKRHA